jgi:hypothetical protein
MHIKLQTLTELTGKTYQQMIDYGLGKKTIRLTEYYQFQSDNCGISRKGIVSDVKC